MNLAIIPHQDDDSLFLAYTLMREKPLVVFVTDSYIQFNRGDDITAGERNLEAQEAMKILGCSMFLGRLPDDTCTFDDVFKFLCNFTNFDKVYIPAVIENGNVHHNMIGEAGLIIWPDAIRYMSYSRTDLLKKGKTEIVPTQEEIELKNKALDCYQSQINLGATRPHFDAVRNRSEFYE